jgi:hypothetical protein
MLLSNGNNKQMKIGNFNKPSSLVHEICIEQVNGWKLFKFSELLQRELH